MGRRITTTATGSKSYRGAPFRQSQNVPVGKWGRWKTLRDFNGMPLRAHRQEELLKMIDTALDAQGA